MSEIIKTGPFEGWTDIMPITETAEKKLRPCAFCGRMPKTIYAVFSFTRREVCTQVVCMHKGCPVEYTEAPALRMFSVMEWNARPIEDARAARIAELEKEKSELLAKCEKYECEIGLAKQQIAALESKSNMYIDLSVAMASTARKVDGLEKERDRLREVVEKLVWLYSDEHQERLDNELRIDGFYSHEWLGMILDMAREAMKGAEE